MQSYSVKEIEQLRSQRTLVIINGKVLDVATYLESHPGGKNILLEVAGTNTTEDFEQAGHSDEANEILQDLAIGVVRRYDQRASSEAEARRSASALFQSETPMQGPSHSSKPLSRLLVVASAAAVLALFLRLLVRHAGGLLRVLTTVPLLQAACTSASSIPSFWILFLDLVLLLLIAAFMSWAASIIYVELGTGDTRR
ncbi:cytochrome b5-like heme/steroid binding domain-containing protein [Aspergillus granulosus]|uniref:Cytochrome b5-like heme/steroid binding domain-containing protein n=1 Tax=Aspergillus granulosus TaxID=176169 RepID=A0ABR4H0Z9_9EURO